MTGFKPNHVDLRKTAPDAAATEASVLAAAAGAPAYIQRRGTVLVLVIGVLALMAIIVVVYTTLGQTDRRSASALIRQTRVEDQSAAIADYLARLIGKETFKTNYQYDSAYQGLLSNSTSQLKPNSSTPQLIRAATTIPSVNPMAISSLPDPTNAPTPRTATIDQDLLPFLVFRPDGTVPSPWPLPNIAGQPIDPRYATTPFLASSEPTWIDPTNNINHNAPNRPWEDYKDWPVISNIAPSGNPVNLANIRNNFFAESGIGTSPDGRSRTTNNLFNYDRNGNVTKNLPSRNGAPVVAADLNFPADWTTNQLRLFRSSIDTAYSAGDCRYGPNQYCDADGDGFFDSRWFELVDCTDPSNARRVLPVSGPMRLFVGARIIDLSGKVNLNTATQFRTAPSYREAAGSSPADIDLERLLTMSDFDPAVVGPPPGGGMLAVGYESMAQPATPFIRSGGTNSSAGNYLAPSRYSAQAYDVGLASFAAIKDAMIPGVSPIPGEAYPPFYVRRGFGPFLPAPTGFAGPTNVWIPGDRLSSYNFAGSSPSGAVLQAAQANPTPANPNVYLYQVSFGKADELELRTYERVNNPSVLSRLEVVAGGRLADYPNFSPLRDNRSLDIEKLSNLRIDYALLQSHIDVRQRVTGYSGSRPLISADVSATPNIINPSTETRLDINTLLARFDKKSLSGTSDPFNPKTDRNRVDAAQQLYNIVAEALVPFAFEPAVNNRNLNVAWTSASNAAGAPDPVGVQMRALAYSGDCHVPGAPATQPQFAGIAAERALRFAAHWTANIIDGRESFNYYTNGGTPPTNYAGDWASEFMVLLDGTPAFRTRLDNIIRYGPSSNDPEMFPAWPSPNRDLEYVAVHEQRPRMAVPLVLNDATRLIQNTVVGGPDLPQTVSRLPVALASSNASVSDPIPADPSTATPAAHNPAELSAQAINVYGIKPQPFITQMNSISIYTDFPRILKRGDSVNDPGGPDGDDLRDASLPFDRITNTYQEPRRLITIHGRIRNNPDYICELVGFQLHNPFDTTIYLSSYKNEQGVAADQALTQNALRYYVEYGGKYYAVANGNAADSWTSRTATTVVLQPGETRMFYIIDQSFETISARMQAADPLLNAGDAKQILNDWIKSQFVLGSDSPAPVRMPEIDPAALTIKPAPQAGVDPLGIFPEVPTNATAYMYRQARLWRVVRTRGAESLGTNLNSTANDVLVDRLRDPNPDTTKVSLNRRLPARQNRIVGSNQQPGNNNGITIAMWGQIRRPSRLSQGNSLAIPKGVLPPWCVEVKSTLPLTDISGNVLANQDSSDPRWLRAPGVKSLNKADFTPNLTAGVPTWLTFNGTQPYAALRLANRAGVANGLIRSNATPVSENFPKHPRSQDVAIPRLNQNAASPSGSNLSGIAFPFMQLPLMLPPPRVAGAPSADALLGQSYANVYGFERDNTTPESNKFPLPPALRPADLLTYWAVGPSKNPGASIIVNGQSNPLPLSDPRCLDAQWTTLAEAAALALDYDSPKDERDVDYRIGAVVTDYNQVQGALDRGTLMPDRFVPFEDRNRDGKFDPPIAVGPAGIATNGDISRNGGIPFVASLLDRFKTTKWGSETESVQGLVNISTASLAVQRTLPLLTPDLDGWLGAGSGAPTPYFDGSAARHANDPWDIAATIFAYGNKSRMESRHTPGTPTALEANFRNDNHNNTFPPPVIFGERQYGRGFATGIHGLRELPGFASTAEIFCARFADKVIGETNVAQQVLDERRRMSIDRLGRDGVVFNVPEGPGGTTFVKGLTPFYNRTGNTTKPVEPSKVVDDPSEKMAIANAVLNTISVRSDFFCVWFVVQGYLPGDVEGLESWTGKVNADGTNQTGIPPNEDRYRAPMVPSLQRRYVMVVDRSNVVSQGDKPKVLMLEEVPME